MHLRYWAARTQHQHTRGHAREALGMPLQNSGSWLNPHQTARIVARSCATNLSGTGDARPGPHPDRAHVPSARLRLRPDPSAHRVTASRARSGVVKPPRNPVDAIGMRPAGTSWWPHDEQPMTLTTRRPRISLPHSHPTSPGALHSRSSQKRAYAPTPPARTRKSNVDPLIAALLTLASCTPVRLQPLPRAYPPSTGTTQRQETEGLRDGLDNSIERRVTTDATMCPTYVVSAPAKPVPTGASGISATRIPILARGRHPRGQRAGRTRRRR